MKEKILLIDGSSLIFRAFYAIRNLTNRDGIPTNGVYGFLRMYKKVFDEVDPDYVAVCFDRSEKTFRHEDYEAYKAQREKAPSELSIQFSILQEVLSYMNVTHLDKKGYEADDLCGTLANRAKDQGLSVYIVTGDKDYLQLVDDDIRVYLTRKGISEMEEYDPERIEEDYGLKPRQLIDVKGLQGDQSDNIPGVPGVGEKTALKYIKKYGSIENLYDHIGDIRGKQRINLEENESQAFMSKELGTIILDVPLDVEMEDLRVKEPDYDLLRECFEKLDFNAFLKELPDEERDEDLSKSAILIKKEDWPLILKKIEGEDNIQVMAFFSGEDYHKDDLAIFSLYISREKKAYIIRAKEDLPLFFESFGESLEKKYISGYDLKPIIYAFSKEGYELKIKDDSMILEYLYDPSNMKVSAPYAIEKFLGLSFKDEEAVLGKGKSKKNIMDLTDEEIIDYISGPIYNLEKLANKLFGQIKDLGMEDLYKRVEIPLIRVLSDMELEGIEADPESLDQLGQVFDQNIRDLEVRIYDYAGREFNINSPKQLSQVLFEDLGLRPIKKTKTGYSTNQEVLEKLRDDHPIADLIIEYRTMAKLKSTYIDGLKPEIMEDGRVRSHFMQNVTATGRISSVDPNLQNIPIREENGRLIRKAFKAKEGFLFVDADYSQIELRVLSHLSKDENMQEAFKEGQDIHKKTAAQVNGIPIDQVTPEERSKAKAVNFGIIYGISDYGLSRDLGISRKEAKDYMDSYLASYPRVKEYMEEIVEEAKDRGYVETLFHRRRNVDELKNQNKNVRNFGERIALNTPIQGTAADIIKIAMIEVHRKLKEGGFKSKLVLQVHDELMIESCEDEKEEVKKLLKDTMENTIDLDVDLDVDLTEGRSWYEAK